MVCTDLYVREDLNVVVDWYQHTIHHSHVQLLGQLVQALKHKDVKSQTIVCKFKVLIKQLFWPI